MHRVFIVEDDLNQLTLLQNTIQEAYPAWSVETARNFNDAQNIIKVSALSAPFTLFLLDVQLTSQAGDRGGFFLAELIRSSPAYYQVPILFLTAVSDDNYFALSHFHCYNYIPKPYTPEDILTQIHQMLMTGYLESASLDISDINRVLHRCAPASICYIKSQAHTLRFFCKESQFDSRQYTLESILPLLDSRFVQCHKQYIINKQEVQSYDRTVRRVFVHNADLPVGKSFIARLNSQLP